MGEIRSREAFFLGSSSRQVFKSYLGGRFNPLRDFLYAIGGG